ncbi:MAG: hypothetical protein GOMPHAMPRED_003279 [Gomphillus americanus]|uniref:Uncharacterized protein n=1 Tax=Gomphillus americanus TaxID=1940652 RepID=A0A8H3EKA7_9LECA|nr:MAG: hypothetical protein GOMPHAMPRED_003279 [Gomphillus americanus]
MPRDVLPSGLKHFLNAWNGSQRIGPQPDDLTSYPGPWGDELKRIRIDYIRVSKLETEILGQSRFSKLKILMLQPFGQDSVPYFEASDENDSWRWTFRHIAESDATKLARGILTDVSSLALRCISDEGAPFGGLLSWSSAEKIPKQAAAMKLSLTKTDWLFLNNASAEAWSARFHSADKYKSPSFLSNPLRSAVNRRVSYISALPIEEA